MSKPSSAIIRLRLSGLAELFNSMDPAPFIERDLAADAEEHITSWARELPAGQVCELVIQLATPEPLHRTVGVENAIRRYFAARAAFKRLELGQLMRRGRLSLCVGSVFLVGCLFLGEIVAKSHFTAVATIIKEGLTIGGWVAMWRPLEIYLYDWWPLLEQRRRLELLARLRVRIVQPSPGVPDLFGGAPMEPVRVAA